MPWLNWTMPTRATLKRASSIKQKSKLLTLSSCWPTVMPILLKRWPLNATIPFRKAELLKIAEVTRHVPEYPARTFYEACQSIISYEYACFMEQNASSYNLGRLDQYLYPYYKKDKEAGILTDDDAQELLDCLWIKVLKCPFSRMKLQLSMPPATALRSRRAAAVLTSMATTPATN